MEDASAVDLDWFWRGWFFTNEHVDMSIDAVSWYQIDNGDPDAALTFRNKTEEEKSPMLNYDRNKMDVPETRIETDPTLTDFYTAGKRYEVTELDRQEYQEMLAKLSDEERAMMNKSDQFYEITFSNQGGLVMPLIVRFDYVDGTSETIHIPAEIWRKNDKKVTKVFKVTKEAKGIYLDPNQECADVDMNNNSWPAVSHPSRFELFKSNFRGGAGENEMQRNQRASGEKK